MSERYLLRAIPTFGIGFHVTVNYALMATLPGPCGCRALGFAGGSPAEITQMLGIDRNMFDAHMSIAI